LMLYTVPLARAPAAMPERIGVLLVNLGTPDSPSYFAVQRYLREFLSDRRVIDTSRLIWLPLLYGVVLPLRPIRTVRNYRRVWMQGGSPLAVYSQRLTAKVGRKMQEHFGDRVRVALGMTYGNPSLAESIQALADENVTRLLVLPLYPQYCSSTTGSVFDRTCRAMRRRQRQPETRFVNGYFDDPGYVDALTESIRKHWAAIGGRSHLLFSYHGIPAVYVAEGDPYQAQAETTTRLVVARLGLAPGEWSHCYQSRFGSVVWLQP
jgi:ferrochelatase